ncbi:hypothetical protein KUTeg_000857 [Tegillarca granosa]|uniref:Uncharacterized protein n=1 Tax=Tegillarca granosa TaxID=220873 RepID=A0ABQ9FYP5_TEGGR|nr:hypothetical protein KUTeg_000857 [Tegillarca granosa]
MAGENDAQYEASDEASESELLDKSLSVWKGQWNVKEVFDPVPLDLHTASSIGQYDCVRSFIQSQQVDLNRRNHGGWTPLMYACYIGHDNIVNLLLEAEGGGVCMGLMYHMCGSLNKRIENRVHGSQVLVEPSMSVTPFMEAAAEGHEIIVQTFLQHGVNVNSKAHNGDTARSLAIIHGHMKIVSLIDNHVLPFSCLRSEAGLDGDLSSSDEAYPSGRKHQPTWGHRTKIRKPCIRDGPDAIARLIDRSRHPEAKNQHPNVPKGYVTFPQIEAESGESPKLSYRDVTSPINPQDYHLSSSGGRDSTVNIIQTLTDINSCDNDGDEDGNAFSKTGALTIKSSSGSSGGLVAAFGLNRDNSVDSGEDFHPHDSCSSNVSRSESQSSLDGSTGGLEKGHDMPSSSKKISHLETGHEIALGGSALSPATSFNLKDSNHGKGNTSHQFSSSNSRNDQETNSITKARSDIHSSKNKSESNHKQQSDQIINSSYLSSQGQQTSALTSDSQPTSLNSRNPAWSTGENSQSSVDSRIQHAWTHSQKPQVYDPRVHISGTPIHLHGLSPQINQSGTQLNPPPPDSRLPPPDMRVPPSGSHLNPTGLDTRVPPPGFDPRFQIPGPQSQLSDPNAQVPLSPSTISTSQIGIESGQPRDLQTLLEQLGLTKYLAVFEEQDVDLQVVWTKKEINQCYSKAYEQVSSLQNQVLQEQQIRNVAERCVVEEHGMWQHIHRIVADTRQKCEEMKEIIKKLKHFHSEMKLKIQQPITSAETKHITELTNAIKQDLQLDDRTDGYTNNNTLNSSSTDFIIKQVEIHMKELQQNLALITKNSDKLLGRTSGEIAQQQSGSHQQGSGHQQNSGHQQSGGYSSHQHSGSYS